MSCLRHASVIAIALASIAAGQGNLRIDTDANLPNGRVGSPYLVNLSARGGQPPYRWDVTGSALPEGLTLVRLTGTIAGIPTRAGEYRFTIRVRDASDDDDDDDGGGQDSKEFRLIIESIQLLQVQTANLPAATVGAAYSATLTASGGRQPYAWSISSGALPPGIALNASNGNLTGTPPAAGAYDFTARVTDDANQSATRALRITVNPAPSPPVVTTAALPLATVGQAYNATLTSSGGTPPYTWTLSAGSLPGGLTLSSAGAISGTPTAAGPFDFTARVTDAANQSATRVLRITVNPAPPPPLTVTTTSLPSGTVGQTYAASLIASGGTSPYRWSLSAGTFAPGLQLAENGAITGTPTAAGAYDFTAQVIDAANQSATKPLRISITVTTLSITTTSLPAGTVGQPYTGSFAASGGTPPYTWTAPAGTFAPGLVLASNGAISGTPTAAGAFDFTVRVADSAGQSAMRQMRFTISPPGPPPTITTSALPAAVVGSAYSQLLAVSGGRAPYTWAVASGALPAGVILEGATGRLTGTPAAAGTFNFTARVSDADSRTGERALAINVATAVSISGCPAATGSVGTEYGALLAASGGTPPYMWSVVSGQMPPGVILVATSGLFSGIPILPGTFTFTLNVSDASLRSATRTCTVIISSPLQITTEALPDATTRAAYSQTLLGNGGTPPYRWTTVGGSLPPGMSLDVTTGVVAGQPNQPGRFTFTVQLTDAVNAQVQRSYAINVVTGLTIPSCPSPVAMVNQAYTSTLTAVGGQSPYTWSTSAGSLPQGLTIATTGTISGTPSTAGAVEFSVQVVDAAGQNASRACSIQVAAELTITTSSLAAGETGAPYTAAISASGGTPPYNWTIPAGTLAPGLTLNSANGQITGTPSGSGVFRFTARVADASGVTRERPFEINIGSGFSITACPAPSAVAGEPYSSSLSLTGGEAPVTWVLASGSLPSGLTLNPQSGTITGTPTAIALAEFVARATDARSRATTRACSINVTPSALRISGPDPLPDAILGSAYQQSLQVTGGRGPFAWSILDGALPAGLIFAGSGSITGSPSTFGISRFTVRVGDADGAAATRTFDLRILPAQAPAITFGDLPDIVPPAQQPRVRVVLDSGYPVPLTGRMTLRFTPDSGLNVDDPSIRFVTGERAVTFEVPANSTEAVFPVPQLLLQTGSVAGTIDLNATLSAGDLDITPSPGPAKSVRIDRTAPVITNVRVNVIAGGFEVAITGFSTTREVRSATFQFTPAAGSRLDSSQVTVETDAAARQWFSDTRSNGFGGQFTFVQPFTLTNATLSEVGVTLTNGQGTSQPARARF